MDVKDYSQKASQIKERYQDAARDLRSSHERENDNLKETSEAKIKKQAAGYERDKQKMEEESRANNEYYTDKTRETIGRRQADYREKLNTATSKFDQEKNEMRQKYQDKLSDVTNTYQTSAKENNSLHDQSKRFMNERFLKSSGEMQEDYNSKINKFSKNAQHSIEKEKELDHEQRQDIATGYKGELDNLRSKAQEKNFKEVSRLNDDNEKLRTSFSRERGDANEQKDARINDILKQKTEESKHGQQKFAELRTKISDKEAIDQQQARDSKTKEAKDLEHKYNEDIKSIKRMANQKIQSNGETEGLQEDNKRLRTVYENRIQTLGKNIKVDTDRMSEKENQNVIDTRDKLANLKAKYNEEREVNDRVRDHEKNKEIQKLTDKNANAIDRYKDQTRIQNITSENYLEKKSKESKERLKEQRIEFGKVVNNITEKNSENLTSLKEDFAKDKTQIQLKNQLELSDEKRALRDRLQTALSQKDNLSQKKIDDIKKETDKMAENYEAKLEHISRENDKQMEMLKAVSEEKQIKQEQVASLELDMNKHEHELEMKTLRSRYERIIDKDRIVGEQQSGRIMQKYEDQLERERNAHQKEMSLRTNEAQAQFERLYKVAELEKETLKSQFEDRIENMRLASLEQVNSKKA